MSAWPSPRQQQSNIRQLSSVCSEDASLELIVSFLEAS
jgi:hypothetical protein